MTRRFLTLLCTVTLLYSPAYAAELPVRRIMLYKHGVGYFERSGKTDGADVVLEFKASEMNDVLKSLTLIDRAGGRVAGVSYESSDPLEKQLQNFAFKMPPGAGMAEVFDQFKGAKIIVKNAGGEVRGSILGAHRAEHDLTILTLLAEDGDVRNVPVTESTSVRLADARQQAELVNYLTVIAGGQRRDLRALSIHPGSAKELTVGYVVEAPVWKSSYRLVFDARKSGEALLQGWAIVDNPSNEDWKDVELSLVSGLPISFTQNLYAPHYMHRQEVPLPFEQAVGPQTYEGAIAKKLDQVRAIAAERDYRKESNQAGAVQAMKSQAMAPTVMASAGLIGGMAGLAKDEAAAAIFGSVEAAAQGVELGDLFEYRVEKRLDVPRHESAMIPFVQASVKAERVLLFDPAAGRLMPFDAVLLTNTSRLTLDGGAITVLDGDRYLGEALIQNMKPGESRPVSFAVDLGTRLSTTADSHSDQILSVKVHRGIVTTTSKNVDVKTYTVRSNDDRERTLILQHPVRPGWKLASDTSKPEETTAHDYRFRVALPAKATTKFVVTEEMEYPSTVALNNLSSDQIALYVHGRGVSADAQAKLQSIVALKNRLADLQNRVTQKQTEINELRQDQDRLRQNINNLRGLPGMDAQVTSYAAKLGQQEKTIEGLQASLTSERAAARQAQQELDRSIATLEI